MNRYKNPWTEKEKRYLRRYYAASTVKQISKRLGRTPFAVQLKAQSMKLARPTNKWTAEEKQWLRDNYHTADMLEMEQRFSRSSKAISVKAFELGLTGKRYSVNNYMAGRAKEMKTDAIIRRTWMEEQIEFVKRNYATMSNKDIAKHVNHSADSVAQLAQELKLTNTKTIKVPRERKKPEKIKVIRERKPKVKQEKPVKQVIERVIVNPRRRAMEQPIKTIPFTTEGKKAVKIDHKTTIYVSALATDSDIEQIKQRYKKAS